MNNPLTDQALYGLAAPSGHMITRFRLKSLGEALRRARIEKLVLMAKDGGQVYRFAGLEGDICTWKPIFSKEERQMEIEKTK